MATMTEPLSQEFRARLADLSPDQSVRVILVLNVRGGVNADKRRATPDQRRAAAKHARQRGEAVLSDIDRMLECVGGKRVSELAGALGTVAVEIPVKAIETVAERDDIKAILEDQKLKLIE